MSQRDKIYGMNVLIRAKHWIAACCSAFVCAYASGRWMALSYCYDSEVGAGPFIDQ